MTNDRYSYLPPKRNSFGHVTRIKDNLKLYEVVRGFVNDNCFMVHHSDIEIHISEYSTEQRMLANRYVCEITERFGTGNRFCPSGVDPQYSTIVMDWKVNAVMLDKILDYIESIDCWPVSKSLSISFILKYRFNFKLDASLIKADQHSHSSLMVWLGSRRLIQPKFIYFNIDTLLNIESAIVSSGLFDLNRANYRLNNRKTNLGLG